MWRSHKLWAVALATLATVLPADPALSADPKVAGPSKVQAIEGSKLKRVTLTQRAADRIDVQTGQVGEEPSGRRFTPYASILYDVAGDAWVYTSPAPLTYLRHSVVVEQIKGVNAFLREGPSVGTQVVTVGVAELYGAEKGIGH